MGDVERDDDRVRLRLFQWGTFLTSAMVAIFLTYAFVSYDIRYGFLLLTLAVGTTGTVVGLALAESGRVGRAISIRAAAIAATMLLIIVAFVTLIPSYMDDLLLHLVVTVFAYGGALQVVASRRTRKTRTSVPPTLDMALEEIRRSLSTTREALPLVEAELQAREEMLKSLTNEAALQLASAEESQAIAAIHADRAKLIGHYMAKHSRVDQVKYMLIGTGLGAALSIPVGIAINLFTK